MDPTQLVFAGINVKDVDKLFSSIISLGKRFNHVKALT